MIMVQAICSLNRCSSAPSQAFGDGTAVSQPWPDLIAAMLSHWVSLMLRLVIEWLIRLGCQMENSFEDLRRDDWLEPV
jgi:hypothetical protein